ncbi:MAG: hypothetical protein F6K09_01720 [Merismopedia sp. SIO2A8]|nr:hypothetical protein [Symploca sp. SIO2B6]NET47446.1 hypothetical protein [Merismopedia sp. SIO2A8]
MKKYINQIGKWLAAVVVSITIIQANALSANAEIIAPGEIFEGPLVPQFEIVAVNCKSPDFGEYSFEVSSRNMPLSNRNFVPCGNPSAIDSYFPPGTVVEDKVTIKNIGEVEINVEPIVR